MRDRESAVLLRVVRRPALRALPMVFGLGLIGLSAGCKKDTPPPPPPAPSSEEVAPLPPPRPLVTQAQFDKLLYDMSYDAVVELLGGEPSRQESTYSEGVDGYTGPSLTSWYIWENPDGSYMKLGFTKKKLTDMVSEDLPEGDGA